MMVIKKKKFKRGRENDYITVFLFFAFVDSDRYVQPSDHIIRRSVSIFTTVPDS